MVAFKAALLWLSTSAYVLALPASNKDAEYKYDINGELLSSGADKRSNSYPVCKNDRNYSALVRNKAKASPFCSTYLRSTKITTVTPTIRKTTTRSDIKTATVRQTSTVTTQKNTVATARVTDTSTATQTMTVTAQVTDTKTDLTTITLTDDLTNTATALATRTATVEVTVDITKQVTDTVTIEVTDTITNQITSTVTEGTTDTESKTVTVISTVPAPIQTVTANKYHCSITGYGTAQYSVAAGPSGSGNFASCKAFCSTVSGAVSFGYGGGQCSCYNAPAEINARKQASQYYFSDLACPSENPPPAKRAVTQPKLPDYIPCDDPRDVSSACSCLITKPAVPTTKTATAYPKTITATVTKCKTVTVTKPTTVTKTNQKTVTTTQHQTIIKTAYKTVTATHHNDATVTNTVTNEVTEYDTITMTAYNTISATEYNTAYFTNTDMVSQTDTDTLTATNTNYETITNTVTVTETSTATSTFTPPTVTATITQNGFEYGS
ncbi:uncharacterized protein TRIVIDRAFT_201614 [Trichoderma virens Gv29-8]|uniref:WSC domain-containing protein n=1 Tax=Hypocrea virens (strain Gv29-8 / FGSC 10586) TaxID=413071 RepID=G9MUH3_HYPVG|nr:uncharacterized protein TRIVIDRAFT_201614 [Trichoderma virens Gv29-8]EHK21917.1 hypothetical protein TRIVIDRAFT_201614 [Trichoderma virens Gv29-8]UKZ54348.1 hypothetical protein TrVGV298_008156 [Trichoderma virens]